MKLGRECHQAFFYLCEYLTAKSCIAEHFFSLQCHSFKTFFNRNKLGRLTPANSASPFAIFAL